MHTEPVQETTYDQIHFGITQEPFNRHALAASAAKGGAGHCAGAGPARGFSVVVGHPGVGKSVLRQHIEQLGEARNTVVVSISRTMHTYNNILKQLAESFTCPYHYGTRSRL